MNAEDVSKLLTEAGQKYSTLRCEFGVRVYPEVAAKAERHQVEAGKVKLVGLSPDEAFGDWEALAGEVTESRALVWVRRPDGYREQDFDEDNPQLLVRNGSAWWCRSGTNGVSSGHSASDEETVAVLGRYEVCVRPEPLTSRLDIEVLGVGERVGREVIRTRARRLPREPTTAASANLVGFQANDYLPVFANGDDDFTVEVDAATGVILRIASVFESQDWMVIEATKAVFNEPLPEDTFTVP